MFLIKFVFQLLLAAVLAAAGLSQYPSFSGMAAFLAAAIIVPLPLWNGLMKKCFGGARLAAVILLLILAVSNTQATPSGSTGTAVTPDTTPVSVPTETEPATTPATTPEETVPEETVPVVTPVTLPEETTPAATAEPQREIPGKANYQGHVYTGGDYSEKYHYEANCPGKNSHEITWEDVDRLGLEPCGTCVLK